MTLDHIKLALQDRRLSVIAKKIGLHYNTLRLIRDSDDANPTANVLKKIEEYLNAQR